MPISILIVDDHTPFRAALRALLEVDERVRVVGEAVDGEEAVTKARELRPDVVLMDVSMPGIGGIEATRRILEAAPSTHVIALTMHDDEAHGALLRDAGARCVVSKGGDAEAIWAAIFAWAAPKTPANAPSANAAAPPAPDRGAD